jgi:hypothetical protein
MVCDAKDTFDKRCDARARPDIASKAPRFRAFAQQSWKSGTLRQGQAMEACRVHRFILLSVVAANPTYALHYNRARLHEEKFMRLM